MRPALLLLLLALNGCAYATRGPRQTVVPEGFTVFCASQRTLKAFLSLQDQGEKTAAFALIGVTISDSGEITVEDVNLAHPCTAPRRGVPFLSVPTSDPRILKVRPLGSELPGWLYMWKNENVRVIQP